MVVTIIEEASKYSYNELYLLYKHNEGELDFINNVPFVKYKSMEENK